ncbi:hypothetical protein IA57_09595 [Mangrovimonas yunxiaonensis]|uniref:DUF922 domain-containing protein n=1 Tax=Mangrovimonas yunxiaonensis TaxID=1197477 RepID=A0A084TJ21_9FLAO|nr:DUF922 domain-containing protein [Mangrovimonas yunxiaonensis]KFB00707.1 hypothetical protein IA57_09595 [Mangrovimonas yunxiaonensis]
MIRLLMVCCFFVGFSQDNEQAIPWHDTLSLSWTDFKARPDHTSSAAAVTASGFVFAYAVKTTNEKITGFNAEVTSWFYPDKSWFKKALVNDRVLAHEQLHFAITELFARKLRQQLSQLNVSDKIKDTIDHAHANALKALAAYQDQYDTETDYSRNLEAQLRWQQQVYLELDKLSDFKP